MFLKKIQYKGKIIQHTPTGANLGIQSNIFDQFVYLHKLPPYSPGRFISEVLFHSLLADTNAMLKKGLQDQQEHSKKRVSTAISTKYRKVIQQTTVLNSNSLSVPLSPSPTLYQPPPPPPPKSQLCSIRKLLAIKTDLSYQ